MSVTPTGQDSPQPGPRRVRHQVRDGLAVMVFSAAASSAAAVLLVLLLRVAS